MTRIAIVTGSTRPGRINQVAQRVLGQAAGRPDAEFEIVDIADFNLPLLDEAYPAAYQNYQNDHTKAFSAKIAEFDGYIFVVAEYNHSVTGALKNALDYLNVGFNNKAAGFVSYGSKGGARTVEHLRGIASELQLAHVRNQVMFSIFSDGENFSTFNPTEQSASALTPRKGRTEKAPGVAPGVFLSTEYLRTAVSPAPCLLREGGTFRIEPGLFRGPAGLVQPARRAFKMPFLPARPGSAGSAITRGPDRMAPPLPDGAGLLPYPKRR